MQIAIAPRALVLFLAIASAVFPALASSSTTTSWWPDFVTPKNANVGWVAKDMVYNGIPMQIRDMKSALNAEKVIDFYRTSWANDDAKATPLQFEKRAPWYYLHKKTELFHYTVQVRDIEKGSEAILTISRLPEMANRLRTDENYMKKIAAARGAGFPKLHGSIVQMDIDSYDEEKNARTIMYRNNYDVENNVLFVSESLINSGWSKIADRKTKAADFGRYLIFQKMNEEITMTIRQASGTTEVLANHTRTL